MSRRGFTLIELLIVVVIIGLLAAIAIPKFSNTKEKAYVAAMKSDLRNLATAEEAFFYDSAKYTTNFALMGNFISSAGVVLNITDEPVRNFDFLDGMARRLGLPSPACDEDAPIPPSWRCSNEAARSVLGWAPTHSIWPNATANRRA